jgi:hypothetical protein
MAIFNSYVSLPEGILRGSHGPRALKDPWEIAEFYGSATPGCRLRTRPQGNWTIRQAVKQSSGTRKLASLDPKFQILSI